MSEKFDMSGYVDVASRIAEFREKYPDGSLQPADPEHPFALVEVGGSMFVAYAAAAYRTPDDPRPGIGCAWELCPGRTPYTKESELQNAETSAWGRALVAVLAVDTRAGIASRDEVRNRQDGPVTAATPEAIRLLSERIGAHGSYPDAYRDAGYPTVSSLREMLEGLQAPMEAEACQTALGLVPAPVEQATAPASHTPSGDVNNPQEQIPATGGPEAPGDVENGHTAAETATPEPPPDPYRGYKKADLQAAAVLRGLAIDGNVAELHERLRENDAKAEGVWLCEVPGDRCFLAATNESDGHRYCEDHRPL